MKKTLYRDSSQKIIGGVAAGLAEYLQTDISIVRILLVIGAFWHHFFGSAVLVIYILLWIILPDKAKGISNAKPFMDASPNPAPPHPASYTTNPSNPEFEANYRVEEPNSAQNSSSGGSDPFNMTTGVLNPVPPHNFQRNQIGGIILVIFGVLFLTEQYIDWDLSYLDRYWPLGLIILGIVLILSTNKSKVKTL